MSWLVAVRDRASALFEIVGDGTARPRWTPANVAAAMFAVVFATAQISVPVLALFEERPARYGWQMFSGAPPIPRFGVEAGDSVRAVDPARYLVHMRADTRFDGLPAHLCRVLPEARAVRVTDRDGYERRVSCP